jgi:DNA/RNA-binding domain of Phe-tRNA-synthetase-like protein
VTDPAFPRYTLPSVSPSYLRQAPHPLLGARAFTTELPNIASDERITRWLAEDAPAPCASSDAIRGAVRDLLRHGGYKPTGRGKPASEYLIRAAGEGALGPINAAVDACNAVSLHSGLPISVVDLDRASPLLTLAIAPAGSSYVFNASGQTIDVGGLLCLFDGEGPCANAVKDAQRTKTSSETKRTLSILWAPASLVSEADRALTWYTALLDEVGAKTEVVAMRIE